MLLVRNRSIIPLPVARPTSPSTGAWSREQFSRVISVFSLNKSVVRTAPFRVKKFSINTGPFTFLKPIPLWTEQLRWQHKLSRLCKFGSMLNKAWKKNTSPRNWVTALSRDSNHDTPRGLSTQLRSKCACLVTFSLFILPRVVKKPDFPCT